MSTPTRIQLSRRKGWRMPPNTIKVDRTTKWGNPFVVGKHGTRGRCVELFRALMAGHVCISVDEDCFAAQLAYITTTRRDRRHLRGKNLACWCPLDSECHADTLLELARK